MPRASRESGQALVIILLILSVVLTVSLSIASRSVTDITVSKKEEDALRAISAAEAGIEQLLKTGAGTTIAGSLPVGSTFNASISGFAQGTQEFFYPTAIGAGDAVSVWFVAHASDGSLLCNGANPCFTGDTIKVYWGNPNTAINDSAPAIEISVLHTSGSGDPSTAKIGRAAYDPNGSRLGSNNFTQADTSNCNLSGRSFAFCKQFTLGSLGVSARPNNTTLRGPQTLRLRLFYNTVDHVVGVSVNFPGNGTLPQQGTKIESLGKAGEAQRKVVVYRPYADIPPIFDFGLYSGTGDLSK